MALGFAVVMSFEGDLHGSHVAPAYVMMCVAIMGLFSACPMLLTWGTNNSAPAGRRAMISSMLTAVANFGGIAGSFMFLDSEAPVYRTSCCDRPPIQEPAALQPSEGLTRDSLTRSLFRHRVRASRSHRGHRHDRLDYPVLLLAAAEQETSGCPRGPGAGEAH